MTPQSKARPEKRLKDLMPSYAKLYKALMKVSSEKLSSTAKVVLSALLDLRELGIPNPKLERLQRETGETRGAIRYALTQLRESGLLRSEKERRANSYRIAPFQDWGEILTAGPQPSADDSDGWPTAHVTAGPQPSGPSAPYSLQDLQKDIEKEGSMRTPTSLSTREQKAVARAAAEVVNSPAPDLLRTLEECREIYRKAGRPFSPKNEQLALQLMLSEPDDVRARMAARLPNYLKWAVVYLWSDPQHTKSLVNVIRDGDWDVELAQREVPAPRKQSVLEQQEQEYIRKHWKGASA